MILFLWPWHKSLHFSCGDIQTPLVSLLERVIAVGRYFTQPYDLMVASGEFSLDRCGNEYEYGGDYECYECKEFLRVNCRITEFQIDVINLYAAQMDIMDKLVGEFPAVLKGVFVEQMFKTRCNLFHHYIACIYWPKTILLPCGLVY